MTPASSAHACPSPEPSQQVDLSGAAANLREFRETSADGRLVIEAMTYLPTRWGTFLVRLFRFDGAPEEHLALSVGGLTGAESLLVRMHSECLTSEVLGSLKCDCADQLELALQSIQRVGRGLVVYLRQEGRGIGLANKLRAYALQSLGADTVDANRLLGLPDDARTYDATAALLKHLGVRSIQLMTNNPDKVNALEQLGVRITRRIPHVVPASPLAVRYLETKRDRMNHAVPAQLPELHNQIREIGEVQPDQPAGERP